MKKIMIKIKRTLQTNMCTLLLRLNLKRFVAFLKCMRLGLQKNMFEVKPKGKALQHFKVEAAVKKKFDKLSELSRYQ